MASVLSLTCGAKMWIREALPSDCHALGELHAASWRIAYRGALSDAFLDTDVVADRCSLWVRQMARPEPGQRIFITGTGDTMAGFCCVLSEHDPVQGAYLNNIHVLQTDQRSGYGRALLHAAASACLPAQADTGLYLFVLQSNHAAQAFYTRFGGVINGTESWDAPDGNTIPAFRMHWASVRALVEATATQPR